MKLLRADSQLSNLDRKLSVLPVYCFEHALHEKRYTTLLERQFKLLGFIEYYLCVLKDLNVSVVKTCLHISLLVPPHGLQQPLMSLMYIYIYKYTLTTYFFFVEPAFLGNYADDATLYSI